MLITDSKTLMEVKREFRQMFPSLKIEFYASQHKAGEGSPAKEQLNSELPIGEARDKHTEGDFKISGDLKVGAFEEAIYKKYGLSVQVFRKSGNLWMQTTSTDHWTLDEQNRKGGSSELHFNEKYNA
jgi:hypothetical protein